MSKTFTLQAVSANHLLDGDVVYLRADGCWSRSIAEANLAESEPAAQALLDQAAQPDVVVGPYLIDVERTPDGPRPLHFRERFRIEGPSVPSDFRSLSRDCAPPRAADDAAQPVARKTSHVPL